MTGKSAPTLIYSTDKGLNKGFYQIPQSFMQVIFKHFSYNQAKILLTLCGTKAGFKPSAKWMTQQTGLASNVYFKNKAELIKQNYIVYDAAKNTISINYEKIYAML